MIPEDRGKAGTPQAADGAWPPLPYDAWKDTCATLHLWTQIVGKIRLACTAWVNHSWHVTQYVTPRGLTTSAIPYGRRTFQIDMDFVDHALTISASDGARTGFALRSRSVAAFHRRILEELEGLGLPVRIHGAPNEVEQAIPFAEDEVHGAYDPEYANRFARALASADRVLDDFRADFIGKCSPVHFFWGGFDLAVTRFSGRPAPPHPGGFPNLPDWVTREAYSHEVSSAGFWPGGESHPEPVFYSYAYPEPEGFSGWPVRPEAAGWDTGLSEFLLPYEAMRTAKDPDRELRAFLESTYEAAAELAGWDRSLLEWAPGERPPPQGS